MASVNKVILLGRLGADPELRRTPADANNPNGFAIATVNLATSKRFKNRSGEQQEQTEWHRLVFFGNLAETVSKYLKKGAQVYVEGKLKTRKWTDASGQERYTTEVVMADFDDKMVMLGSASGGQSRTSDFGASSSFGGAQPTTSNTRPVAELDVDDDVPF